MSTALPTVSSAYGPDRPSAVATVDNATPQGSTYRRGNPVQRNGAGSKNGLKITGNLSCFHYRRNVFRTN